MTLACPTGSTKTIEVVGVAVFTCREWGETVSPNTQDFRTDPLPAHRASKIETSSNPRRVHITLKG